MSHTNELLIKEVNSYLQNNTALLKSLDIDVSTPLELQHLAKGEYNDNYVFEHPKTAKKYVLRINKGSQMHLDNQIGYEARALELLASCERTPHVHYVDTSKQLAGHGVLVEDWLSGRPLRYETDLTLAAQILADIHSTAVPADHGLHAPDNPLKNIVDECTAMFEVYRAWPQAAGEVIDCIDGWFTTCIKRAEQGGGVNARHIINTELNSQNFLIVENNQGATSSLVDWEKPLVAEVEQDIAHFLVPTTTYWKTESILKSQERSTFVHEYIRAVAGRFETSGLEERLAGYLGITCLRGITWSAMALAQHKTGERSVANDYTLGKIEEYLSGGFLKRIDREFF